jgi:hypothetical protein
LQLSNVEFVKNIGIFIPGHANSEPFVNSLGQSKKGAP